MTDTVDHVAWAAEAVTVFQRHCRTGDEHAIAGLEAPGSCKLEPSAGDGICIKTPTRIHYLRRRV